MDIIQHRRVEAQRKEIAQAVVESLAEFRSGKLKPEPVEDIIEKLRLNLKSSIYK